MLDMKRRAFITLLGGAAAAAWPLAARAQQPASTVRRIGFLLPGVARTTAVRGQLEAFRQGLKENGWVEGQNISFEYRFADGKEDTLPGIAAELVQSRPDVIVAEGTPAIQAAKTVTQTVPIVMATSSDPVGTGLVGSLSQPGGNITGPSLQSTELNWRTRAVSTCAFSGFADLFRICRSGGSFHATIRNMLGSRKLSRRPMRSSDGIGLFGWRRKRRHGGIKLKVGRSKFHHLTRRRPEKAKIVP